MKSTNPTSASLQHTLSVLMYFRRWDEVREVLFQSTTRRILDTVDFEGEEKTNLLHMMCRFQPPLDLVEYVDQEWPLLAKMQDSCGHFPLHVASLYGSKSNIVKYLIGVFPDAANFVDTKGKTPLHLACRPIRWQPNLQTKESREPGSIETKNPQDNDEQNVYDNESEADTAQQEVTYIHAGSAVIAALCESAPEASNIEDIEGCNALEIAIEHGLSKKICQLLLDASDKAWKLHQAGLPEFPADGDFHFPGYTPAAARELLKKCRSSRSLQAKIELLNENCQPLPSSDAAVQGETFQNELSISLPPYDEMLATYRDNQKRLLRRGVTVSSSDLQRPTTHSKRRPKKSIHLGQHTSRPSENAKTPSRRVHPSTSAIKPSTALIDLRKGCDQIDNKRGDGSLATTKDFSIGNPSNYVSMSPPQSNPRSRSSIGRAA